MYTNPGSRINYKMLDIFWEEIDRKNSLDLFLLKKNDDSVKGAPPYCQSFLDGLIT